MLLVSSLIYLITALVLVTMPVLASPPPPANKLPCDMLTHVAQNRHVGRASDVTELGAIRIFTFNLNGPEIQEIFDCVGTPMAFTSRPHTIVRGNWQFGTFRVLELTDAGEWTGIQEEEFERRATGYVTWAQAMEPAGWFGRNVHGHAYDYNWSPDPMSIPLMGWANYPLRMRQELATKVKLNISIATSGVESLRKHLKDYLIDQARQKELRRNHNVAYNEGYSRGHRDGHQEGKQKGIEEGRATCTNDYHRGVKEGIMQGIARADAQYARDLQNAETQPRRSHHYEANQCPDANPDANHYQNNHNNNLPTAESLKSLCEYVACPITTQTMKDAVVNTRTGQSYDKEAIVKWVRERGTDPLTRDETAEDDLLENYALRQLIEKVEALVRCDS